MKKPAKAPKTWKGWARVKRGQLAILLDEMDGSGAWIYQGRADARRWWGKDVIRVEVRPLLAKRKKAGTRGK